MKNFSRVLMLGLLLLTIGCGAGAAAKTNRDTSLSDYGNAIRWSEFEKAWQYIDPALRDEQALSDLELERFKQVQITGYDVKRAGPGADGMVEQTVEIRLVNRNTQIERSVIDHQRWRWDAQAKRYWLVSGLPDLTPRQ